MVAWIVAGPVLGLGSALVARCAFAYRRVRPLADEGGRAFAGDRYRPMARLLDAEDLGFLARQPGYRPEIGAKLKRARRRIFRMYLRELAQDFHRQHAEARRIVASLPAQDADLVGILIRQKTQFWRAMAVIEVRLALSRVGVRSVDVRTWLEAFERMQADLSRLVALAPAA